MLLGVERAVVEDVRVELEAIVVSVRPKSREKHRCGVCGRRCAREDSGEGRRRWRALDLGTTQRLSGGRSAARVLQAPSRGRGRGAVGAA